MKNLFRIIKSLKMGETSIGVIGAGFIGTTTAMCYAHEGIKVRLYDIDPKKIERYKAGECDVCGLEQWSGMSLQTYVASGMITPTNDWKDMEPLHIFFVAVPTEKGGEPFMDYIRDVMKMVMMAGPILVVIESTLSPKWIKELGLMDYPVCVAIRRDWFANPLYTLKALPRIYCASSPLLNKLSKKLLGIVSDKLILASSMEAASLVKAVENALWHVQLVAVQELALAYDLDMDEVLTMVATHPMRQRYYPNVKIGGYCVPLGSKYVRESADHPERLAIFLDALEDNEASPAMVTMDVLDRHKHKTIGVLGITYKNDLKVHTLSPGMAMIDILKLTGRKVLVHDSFYSKDEIKKITECDYLNYPEDLADCDLIIITIDHKEYYETPYMDLKSIVRPDTDIFDNLGVWKRHAKFFGERYKRFGVKWRRDGT